jgi:hypothetical protein
MTLAHLLVVAFALLWCGCVSPSAAAQLPIRTLAKGSFSAIQEPKTELIKDQASWEKVWQKHSASSKPAPEVPKVDFSKEMVVLVTMGRKNSGGYSIEVAGAEKAADKLKVTLNKKTPERGSMTIQALTAPFHFVAVPKSDLKTEFVETKGAKE